MKNKNRFYFAVVFLLVIFWVVPAIAVVNTAPVVSNVVASQREGSFIVDITYDVFDLDGDVMWVSVYFSPDGGVTWPVACAAVTGEVGEGVFSGTNRTIEWDAKKDYPGEVMPACSIRVTADDTLPFPYFDGVWKSDLDGGNESLLAYADTVGYGQPFKIRWHGFAPSVVGMAPEALAARDSVFPFDDGLLGYKYLIANDYCDPLAEDCWQPRRFNEATGDSFSFFGQATSLSFYNDGSQSGPFYEFLPSGLFEFQLNTVDVFGYEVAAYRRPVYLTVNYDPQTVLLNGETDWAHPEDPQVYPYYIQLNDPAAERHPFQGGDRIPDRTYVVFKALARDDPRDGIVDPGFGVGFTGYMQGVRRNFMGGYYSFATGASAENYAPAWGVGLDGWYADTLGFLTGPSTEFTMNMQGIDETGRRDGTPANLSFEVGFPPCLQCIELLPKSTSISQVPVDVACAGSGFSSLPVETHPCFQDTTELRITANPTAVDAYLEKIPLVETAMLVDKTTYAVTAGEYVGDPAAQDPTKYYIQVDTYQMKILMHGLDDPREAWSVAQRRLMAIKYQVDYDCDPYNLIQDGGGYDDINGVTWGVIDPSGLAIDPGSGLWSLNVVVPVPRLLMMGPAIYYSYLLSLHAEGDAEIADAILAATTRQFGAGAVQAVALDQTSCSAIPLRPATYPFFKHVRPPAVPSLSTWRDCYLVVPDIKDTLDLSRGAMASNGGVPLLKHFRIVVETSGGEFTCGDTPSF